MDEWYFVCSLKVALKVVELEVHCGARGRVVKALDLRCRGPGFNSLQHWSCVKALGTL